ncbi:Ammonium transporter Rh type C [Trichoplax sp. H2]|nr:Ammonium transporter Rh type C [Trichoplax sp. H2]|eukprot:RDD37533.1 Ammonium transporter Rh type C [Trichoplax sp. H2]
MGILSRKLVIFMTLFELVAIILFAVFVRFDKVALPGSLAVSIPGVTYAMFQDIHVMIFIGFGFLMTFLKKYSFSSVGFNLLLASFVIQWSTLMLGFCHHWSNFRDITIKTEDLIGSDICAAAVLISFGAVLGKTSPLQLMVMALLEVIFYAVNETICFQYLKISDMGGSIVIHAFGAYFGLAVALVMNKKEAVDNPNEGSSYQSDLSAMIGLASGDQQQRAVFNTYFALAACTCTSFVISSLIDREGRYRMVHVQNSTLAGGVAVGASANMLLPIWLSMLTGIIAGIISVIGYDYITPFLAKKRIHDTCGVNNLHAGAIDFPGEPVTAAGQAGLQAAGIGVTLAISIASGLITGCIIRLSIFDEVRTEDYYLDSPHWEIPDEDDNITVTQDDRGSKIKTSEVV